MSLILLLTQQKTKLGLAEVEYVGHVSSATGTSFTEEKWLKVLQFPLPETQKICCSLLFSGSFTQHDRNCTAPTEAHATEEIQGIGKLISTPEAIAAFEFCQVANSNCQELYFLEDTATPILQTDVSDYGIGGYIFMLTNGKVRVVRFFSKALTGAQLNWSVREKNATVSSTEFDSLRTYWITDRSS